MAAWGCQLKAFYNNNFIHTYSRQYPCFRCFVEKHTVVTWQRVFVLLLLGPMPVKVEEVGSRRDWAWVFNICGVIFIGRLCEGGVGPWLVQVDVGDVQTDVVLSLQAWQDGRDGWHQRSEVWPQLRIRVPALEHNAIPGKNADRYSKNFVYSSLNITH